MKHQIPIAIVLLLVLGATAAAAGADQPLTGAFPQLDPSARGTALGGNLVALARGSESVFWNPAGLLGVDRKELGFTYCDLFGLGLVSHTVAAFDWPHLGSKVEWDQSRIRRVPLPPPATRAFGLGFSLLRGELGTDDYIEDQLALAYAWRAGGWQMGLALRLLRAQTNADTSSNGSGQSIDFGLQRRIGSFLFGFSAANLGSWTKWQTAELNGSEIPEENGPLASRWGGALAYHPPRLPLTVAVQGNWAGGAFARVQVGGAAEWLPVPQLALRAAWRRRTDDVGDRSEWSAGAGFLVKDWSFDYGWQDNARDLGTTSRWGASFRF